jgi:hypothetical protein
MKLATPLLYALLSAVSVLVCKSDQVKNLRSTSKGQEDDIPAPTSITKVLSNGRQIPLIGMGVGNLQQGHIE